MSAKTKKKARNNGKHAGGRPSEYNEEKNLVVFNLLAAGGPESSLRKILREMKYVDISQFMRWNIDPDPFFDGFRLQYQRAREAWAFNQVHETIDIAEEEPRVVRRNYDKEGNTVSEVEGYDPAGITRNKLRVDTRHWTIARILSRFGFSEKRQVELNASESLAALILESKGEKDGK